MRKITCATLTFHRTTNYGAIFQTFALQKVLASIGVESEVLDYRCPTIEKRYKVNSLRFFFNIKNILKCIWRNSYIRDNRKNFNQFANQYIRISDKSYTPESISSSNNKYSKFIVGSDQVWNPECMGSDPNFFLSFADSDKKNSYAASFGWAEFSDKQLSDLRKLLVDFKLISVRETSGIEIVQKCVGRPATLVLDPTLLLHQDWYDLATSIPPLINDKYVIVYLMKETDSIFKRSIRYAKTHNLKVVYINDRLFPKKKVFNKFYISPIEWLNLFYNSEGVFTNSFHGTAFAINFNKPLWVELLPEPSKTNSRLIDFLSLVNMEDCIVKRSDFTTDPKIDYSIVNSKLEIYRDNSIEYLKTIFSNE